MMRITHGESQWAKLCAQFKLEPEATTAQELVTILTVTLAHLADEIAHERGERLPRVYVAGPYTHGDVAHNVRAAIFCGDWLAERGCVPFVPHLSHLWHTVSPHSYRFWIEQDLAWLRVCDALVRLPGKSQGADGEVAQANAMELPVFLWPEDGAYLKGFGAWREGWGK